MKIEIQGKWQATRGEAKKTISRKIDIGEIGRQTEQIEQINSLIQDTKLDEAVETLEELLTKAARPKKERIAKPWFDHICYQNRKDVLNSLQSLRANPDNKHLLLSYNNKKRQYKKLLQDKKKTLGRRGKKNSRRSHKRHLHRTQTQKTSAKPLH